MSEQHHCGRGTISGVSEGYVLTVADMRAAIESFPDDAEIIFGTCSHGEPLRFYRFKSRSEKALGIEFN